MAISPATGSRPERRPLTVACGITPRRPQVRPLRRPSGEARLVLEAEVSSAGRPGSFASVQVASFHAVTACSSRSAIRRSGTCGLKPGRCISLVAPETL